MGELSGYLSSPVDTMQPNGPHHIHPPGHLAYAGQAVMMGTVIPTTPPTVPLTQTPQNLVVWRASTPWQTVRSMVGLVIVCFFIAQLAVLVVAGYIDADMNGTLGPSDPALTFVGGICLSPMLMLFLFLRRPNLTHTIHAYPSASGSSLHALAGGQVVRSPQPTFVQHHLFRSNAPLEMPRPKHLWLLFFVGVGASTLCLLPLLFVGVEWWTVLLAVAVVLPAWLVGFSTPVFAWWSITSRHFGINIARRDAEWMLVAGMLSTIPAIVINSLISPMLITPLGLDPYESGTLGEGMVLFLSAPIGEELCKLAAVLCLTRFITSPKYGFYVGSTVGLGFALLENAQYISMSLLGEYSSITYFFTAMLRGLSSIPGHAMWTGLSGYAVGCWLAGRPHHPQRQTRMHTPDQNAEWVMYDKSGHPVGTSTWATVPSDRLVRLLRRHEQHAWAMPTSVGAGLGLAILGHGLWNGSSWGVALMLSDNESLLALALQLAWLAVMVAALWLCILRWLPTIVMGSKASERRD